MKTLLTTIAVVLFFSLHISAQDSPSSKISDKGKIKILAQQIELRDGQISDMTTEISKLNKKLTKKKTGTKAEPQADSKKLETALNDLARITEEKTAIQEKYDALQAQMNNTDSGKTDNIEFKNQLVSVSEKLKTTQATLTEEEVKNGAFEQKIQLLESEIVQLQNKEPETNNASENQMKQSQSQINALQIEKQNLELELNQQQNSILNLQDQLKNMQSRLLTQNKFDAGKSTKKNKTTADIPNEPVKGKNYFYITASKNLEIDNGYGVEIGSIKNFNKRSSSRVKLGLDVAYLSASLINVDLENLDGVLAEPVGAVGLKIGPNIGIRLVKGIQVNLNYRYFAAGNLTVLDEETNIEYKGFHTAGASVKVGPIVGRAEWDISNIIEDESKFDASPLTVYLGLMF